MGMAVVGVERRVDGMGRIVIPSEIRRSLGLQAGSLLDIAVEERRIVLWPQKRACVFCGALEDLREYRQRLVCASCVEKISRLRSGSAGQ